jgi:hypothetical protein
MQSIAKQSIAMQFEFDMRREHGPATPPLNMNPLVLGADDVASSFCICA